MICLEILNKMENKKKSAVNPFGIWIKEKRNNRSWSTRILAERAGEICSHSYISQLENDKATGKKGQFMKPSIEIVETLAITLNESVNEALVLAGYPAKIDPSEQIANDFSYALENYKKLSPLSQAWFRKHVSDVVLHLIELEGSSKHFSSPDVIKLPLVREKKLPEASTGKNKKDS